ncbi:MAG: Spy/CpxP family protein refolding chaperone [Acidobacteriota bacterium]|nr:Spy/CpxP family protein refolding chaperone [Acidobacteriota bacterium]
MVKSTVWSAAAALIVAATVAIPVIAQPPQGDGGRPGRPGFGGRGPFPILRGLELSDAQRDQIRSITQERRTAANGAERPGGELHKQLHLAMLADTPDSQKVEELKAAIAAAAAEELTARIDVQTRIAQVLTPEQRAKAREALAAKTGPPPNRATGQGRRGLRQ